MQRRDFRLSHDGLGFHVTEWGEPDAWPVLMLHGIRGYAETFVGVAAALQPGFRVIAFDQRGRGETDWDPGHDYYTDTYVADVEAWWRSWACSASTCSAIRWAASTPSCMPRTIPAGSADW